MKNNKEKINLAGYTPFETKLYIGFGVFSSFIFYAFNKFDGRSFIEYISSLGMLIVIMLHPIYRVLWDRYYFTIFYICSLFLAGGAFWTCVNIEPTRENVNLHYFLFAPAIYLSLFFIADKIHLILKNEHIIMGIKGMPKIDYHVAMKKSGLNFVSLLILLISIIVPFGILPNIFQ